MFDKNFITKRWKAFYESGPLLDMLKKTFGGDTDLDLENGKLKCLFAGGHYEPNYGLPLANQQQPLC